LKPAPIEIISMTGYLKACGGLAEILSDSQQGKVAVSISIATREKFRETAGFIFR